VESTFQKRGKAFDDKVIMGEQEYTFDELIEVKLMDFKTGSAFGKASHLKLEEISTNDPAKKAEYADRFNIFMDPERAVREGRHPLNPRSFLWLEEAKKAIWKVAGIEQSHISGIDASAQDHVETEVTIASQDLKIASTIDSFVHHENGDISILDWKAGSKFRNDMSTSTLMKHSPSHNEVFDTKLNRAKLEIALRALILKEKYPDMTFRNLRVVHLDPRNSAVTYDVEKNQWC